MNEGQVVPAGIVKVPTETVVLVGIAMGNIVVLAAIAIEDRVLLVRLGSAHVSQWKVVRVLDHILVAEVSSALSDPLEVTKEVVDREVDPQRPKYLNLQLYPNQSARRYHLLNPLSRQTNRLSRSRNATWNLLHRLNMMGFARRSHKR